MSASQDSYSSSLRQRERHAGVERQGLALGAERERARRATSISQDRERQLEGAINDWENEGGAAIGMPPPAPPRLLRKRTTLQLSADLFRDDTLRRAVILNGMLLLIAGGAVVFWRNS